MNRLASIVVRRLGTFAGSAIAGASLGAGVSAAEITAAISLLLGVAVDTLVRRLMGPDE